jgi:FkbM family methyltransferase
MRRAVLPLLRRINPGDITIRHHYTGDPVRLHSYRHKGYWYYGRAREKETMRLFSRLLFQGDSVIEVGGHIGYVSLYFKWLVQHGDVYVFEPGLNNLPYLRRNAGTRGIHIVEKAAGNRNGSEVFFQESLTGQNNSFVRDFKGLECNAANAFVGRPEVTEVTVEMVRLDDFVSSRSIRPSFVKIDVEGFELSVLHGMTDTISRYSPRLMIEVQANQQEIFSMLGAAGYTAFNSELSVCSRHADLRGNIFALHDGLDKFMLNSLELHYPSTARSEVASPSA